MRMPLDVIPEYIIDQYDLKRKAKYGYIYTKILKGTYGLPQAGILAKKLLRKQLPKHGYHKVAHTPSLLKQIWRLIALILMVDDFGVKYFGEEHACHLCEALKTSTYTIEENWRENLYCVSALA